LYMKNKITGVVFLALMLGLYFVSTRPGAPKTPSDFRDAVSDNGAIVDLEADAQGTDAEAASGGAVLTIDPALEGTPEGDRIVTRLDYYTKKASPGK